MNRVRKHIIAPRVHERGRLVLELRARPGKEIAQPHDLHRQAAGVHRHDAAAALAVAAGGMFRHEHASTTLPSVAMPVTIDSESQ